MSATVSTPYREVVAAVYQPYLAAGGPVLVTYTPEGGTATEITTNHLQSGYYWQAKILLTADSGFGPLLDTVVAGPQTSSAVSVSRARTYGFQRQVIMPAGTQYICVTFAVESNRGIANIWRVWTPRAISTVQLRR